MGFALFVLVNAVLFIRPSELVEGLDQANIYEVLILGALFASVLPILQYVFEGKWLDRPILPFVLGLVIVSPLSQVWRGDALKAAEAGAEMFKVLIYLLILLAQVNTRERLLWFCFWITVFSGVAIGLAVLDFNGVIEFRQLDAMVDNRGDELDRVTFKRLRGTGVFGDPNDFTVLMTFSVVLSFYWMIERSSLFLRLFGFGVLVLSLYALVLTKSRGGVLAVFLGMLTLLQVRFGARAAITLLLCVLPIGAIVFLTRVSGAEGDDTVQDRFQLWAQVFVFLRASPLFGIGWGSYAKEAGLAAHNSYVHCFGELGLVGGTLFFAAFLYSLWAMWHVAKQQQHLAMRGLSVRGSHSQPLESWNAGQSGYQSSRPPRLSGNHLVGGDLHGHPGAIANPRQPGNPRSGPATFLAQSSANFILQRLNPYVMGALAGYMGIIMSLSRSYVVPTYMILGLVGVYQEISTKSTTIKPLRLQGRVIQVLLVVTVGFLLLLNLALRILVRYG